MALAGLIAGAIGGGAKAMQTNALGQIEEKRKRALMDLEQSMNFERDDRQWEREKAMTAEERKIEERRRQEDRQWEVADNEAERAHRTRLANIRAASGGGAGGRTPSRIIEARTLMNEDPERWPTFGDAYNEVRSRAGQNTDYGQASDKIDYVTGQIDSIDEALNSEDAAYLYTEDQIKEMKARREMLFQNLQSLERDTYGIGADDQAGKGSPQPGLIAGAQGGGDGDYPQEGDLVGNPEPGQGSSKPTPAAETPSAATSADEIAKQFGF